MSRDRSELTDAQWAVIEPLMPTAGGKGGRPFRDPRQVVEGIIFRFRTGVAWRDVPARFGPWQTVWKRHHRFSTDGTWEQILTELLTQADAVGLIDWVTSVDSSIVRAHQSATTLPRHTGGGIELQQSERRAA